MGEKYAVPAKEEKNGKSCEERDTCTLFAKGKKVIPGGKNQTRQEKKNRAVLPSRKTKSKGS